MGACARRHAAGDPAAVEHHDLLAPARQLIGRGKSGDAGADHHGVARMSSASAGASATTVSIHRERLCSSAAFMANLVDRKGRRPDVKSVVPVQSPALQRSGRAMVPRPRRSRSAAF